MIGDQSLQISFENVIAEVTEKTFPRKAPTTKGELFTLIAQRHLGVETLETRNSDSLDFYDIAVWSIKDALDAAFESGRKARK